MLIMRIVIETIIRDQFRAYKKKPHNINGGGVGITDFGESIGLPIKHVGNRLRVKRWDFVSDISEFNLKRGKHRKNYLKILSTVLFRH